MLNSKGMGESMRYERRVLGEETDGLTSAAHFVLLPLESRVYLSGTPQFESTTERSAVLAAASITAAASPAAISDTGLSLADRRELIARLSAPLAGSLAKTLRHSGPEAFDATLLKYMVRRKGPVYFMNPKRYGSLLGLINQQLSFKVQPTIAQADEILAHLFPEQINSQSNTVQLGADIDWDAQPKSTSNADFLHGLNRHTFWNELATAYRLSGDGKYVRELVAELVSWSEQTPALVNPDDWAASSPHWWLLDAADRANNWTNAYFMVLGAPDWTPAANTLFLKKIWEHGDFLSRVTPGSFKSNKTALHASGLLRIGLMFPEFTAAAGWEYQGFDMTFRALGSQFYPDGGHVEETPAYQASALNAFLENYRLAELNGRTNWTKNRRRLLRNGIEALYQLLTPRGELPGVSDTYRSSNPQLFLTRCGLVLGDRRYILTRPGIEELFLVGPDLVSIQDFNLSGVLVNRGPSYALPDAGYYMLRGEYREQSPGSGEFSSGVQILFDAGPKGGTHGHYDLLNFELQAIVDDVVDPGPLRYDDSAERQYVVSTPAHNTISIDGLNHEAVEGAHDPRIVVDQFTTTPTEARITAHHHAYEFLAGRPTVGRTLWLDRVADERTLAIAIDWGRSDTGHPHTFTSGFTFPSTTVTHSAPGVADVRLTRTTRLRVQSLLTTGQSDSLTDTFISSNPPPDEKTDAKRFAVSQTGTSALFVTLFSEYVQGGTSTVPASIAFDTPPQDGQPVHLRLTLPDGTMRALTFAPPNLAPL